VISIFFFWTESTWRIALPFPFTQIVLSQNGILRYKPHKDFNLKRDLGFPDFLETGSKVISTQVFVCWLYRKIQDLFS
jgi:hypothetical protein